jgi:hypothetical protein
MGRVVANPGLIQVVNVYVLQIVDLDRGHGQF